MFTFHWTFQCISNWWQSISHSFLLLFIMKHRSVYKMYMKHRFGKFWTIIYWMKSDLLIDCRIYLLFSSKITSFIQIFPFFWKTCFFRGECAWREKKSAANSVESIPSNAFVCATSIVLINQKTSYWARVYPREAFSIANCLME